MTTIPGVEYHEAAGYWGLSTCIKRLEIELWLHHWFTVTAPAKYFTSFILAFLVCKMCGLGLEQESVSIFNYKTLNLNKSLYKTHRSLAKLAGEVLGGAGAPLAPLHFLSSWWGCLKLLGLLRTQFEKPWGSWSPRPLPAWILRKSMEMIQRSLI